MIRTILITGLLERSFTYLHSDQYRILNVSFSSSLPTIGNSRLLSTFSSSVYTPAFNQVESNFGISQELALLPFIVYLIGLSFGPVIAAPSSETFGRRTVYQICIPIFAIFTLGARFSQDLTSLVVCRFFAGLFSSPGLSIGTGALSDLWTSDQRGIAMAAYIATYIKMPQLGPAMG